MKLCLTRSYPIKFASDLRKQNFIDPGREFRIYITVESRSGKLNAQTSKIFPIEDLDESVMAVLDKIKQNRFEEAFGIEYIGATIEIFVIRLWEALQDVLGYQHQARLAKIRCTEGRQTSIEYSGIKTSRAKRRRKSG